MAISKLSADQFANLATKATGIILEYAGKDGKNTGLQFFGKDYEPTAKTQDEMFRVLNNLESTFWGVKTAENSFRETNDGVRSKLRATTPLRIIIRTHKGETVKVYDLADSVWAKIGLMPTKLDLERSARDQKKYIHKATKTFMDVLNFRVELPKNEQTGKPGEDSENETSNAA